MALITSGLRAPFERRVAPVIDRIVPSATVMSLIFPLGLRLNPSDGGRDAVTPGPSRRGGRLDRFQRSVRARFLKSCRRLRATGWARRGLRAAARVSTRNRGGVRLRWRASRGGRDGRLLEFQHPGASRLTAAIPMENRFCSCKLTSGVLTSGVLTNGAAQRREQWVRLGGSPLPLPMLNTTGMDADARDLAIQTFYNTRGTSATYPAGRAFATATAVTVATPAPPPTVEGSGGAAEAGAGRCAGYLFGGAAVVLASWREVNNVESRPPTLPRTDWIPLGGPTPPATDPVLDPAQTFPVAFNDLWRFECLANGSVEKHPTIRHETRGSALFPLVLCSLQTDRGTAGLSTHVRSAGVA